MKTRLVLSFFVLLLGFSAFYFQYSIDDTKHITKNEKELDYVISNLGDDDVFIVSDADTERVYLFNRLEEGGVFMKLGSVVYYVKKINNERILYNSFAPVNNVYHLKISYKSTKISADGEFLNTMFIKKVNGPYYDRPAPRSSF